MKIDCVHKALSVHEIEITQFLLNIIKYSLSLGSRKNDVDDARNLQHWLHTAALAAQVPPGISIAGRTIAEDTGQGSHDGTTSHKNKPSCITFK